jgi:Uma2 family endonuclease
MTANAMAGASVHQGIITTNVSSAFNNAADKTECRVYASNMKVRVEEEIFYYPDVVVACGEIADDYYENSPCVIVEVMSKSTARKDALEKRLAYANLSSLQLYLLIDSRKRHVKSYRRIQEKWQETTHQENDVIEIPCLGTTLTLKQIYNKTKLT